MRGNASALGAVCDRMRGGHLVARVGEAISHTSPNMDSTSTSETQVWESLKSSKLERMTVVGNIHLAVLLVKYMEKDSFAPICQLICTMQERSIP